MRLSADTVRAALQHPSEGVRRAAFAYFADAFSQNPADTDAVVRSMEAFGPDQFLRYHNEFEHLRQTEASARWVLGHLPKLPTGKDGPDSLTRERLIRALFECDLDLFSRLESAIFAAPLRADERAALQQRAEFAAASDDTLWDRLAGLCRMLNAHAEPWRTPEVQEGDRIVRVLADRPPAAGRAMHRLANMPVEFDFLDVFAVRLLGRMRHAPAARPLVEFLVDCDEGWEEDLQPALVQIGTDECVALFREFWPRDGEFHSTMAFAFRGIHSDASVAAALDLAAADPHPYRRGSAVPLLLDAAVLNFEPAAVEPARRHLLHSPPDVDPLLSYQNDLRANLLDACELMGATFPEYGGWKAEEARREARYKRQLQDHKLAQLDRVVAESPFAPPAALKAVKAPDRVGRNDPCPCGSGKKFKKCHGQ